MKKFLASEEIVQSLFSRVKAALTITKRGTCRRMRWFMAYFAAPNERGVTRKKKISAIISEFVEARYATICVCRTCSRTQKPIASLHRDDLGLLVVGAYEKDFALVHVGGRGVRIEAESRLRRSTERSDLRRTVDEQSTELEAELQRVRADRGSENPGNTGFW